MIYLLYENPYNVINSFIPQVLELYASSSVVSVSKFDKMDEVVTRLNKPPLFDKGWLIICESNVSSKNVKRLADLSDDNLVICKVVNKKQLENLGRDLRGYEVKLIDRYKIPREEVISWICKELGCANYISDAIYARTNGRLYNLIPAVKTLSLLDNISLVDVQMLVVKNRDCTVGDVADYLLGVQRTSLRYSDITHFIYDFRFAYKWLLKNIIKRVSVYERVFFYASSGELNLINYKEFQENTSDRLLKELPINSLKFVLSKFGEISYEYVYFILQHLRKIHRMSDRLCLIKLINLLNLGG